MHEQWFHRWAPPALPPSPSSATRARHDAEVSRARHEMRWIWNEVCSGLDLTRRVVPTGTVSREPPRMGRITLGPPTRFTVELRPGQLREDLERRSERLAAAFGVPAVRVDDLVRGWVVVVLVEYLEEPAPGAATGPRTIPGPPATVPPPTPLPPPVGRRRRPFGRPRSWGSRRSHRGGV